ncbi:hypothetical protein [Legionella quateirensis]|uniref:Uncharacterized protein n=1 Tax=Legionella quateirensis TaxID=45072 RepID=A0A378KQX0_9GAMM|nr:hypothetical protein [Legionella quateirensis]KTD54785.1 hypothetical protein Lqua_0292 [Legionella quateirensis]STY16965.1 Uncharacterised protein [Legionella quateirensis]
MKNYIGSVHHIRGDRHYNKKEYNKALACYVLGLNVLESKIAKDPEILTSKVFCDQYAYALSDVLNTQSRTLNQFVMGSKTVTTENLLKTLSFYSSLLTTINHRYLAMNESWEFICEEKKCKTKPKQIIIVYTLLTESLELLSDLWSATADEVNSSHPNYETLLNQSCTAMKLAIDIKSRLPESAGIEMHCGYLNLLEQLYYFKKDADFQEALLINMKKHLEQYQLLNGFQDDPVTQLELISYALLVDVHLHGVSNTQLIAQGQEIIASLTERSAANEKVISDFTKLVALSAHISRQGSSSSSSTPISFSVSRNSHQQTRRETAHASSSSSSEIHENSVEQHQLRSAAQLIVRNPERVNQLVDKLYSIGCAEFSRLYPESQIALLAQNNTPSGVKHFLNESIDQSDDTEQFNVLAPALKFIANHYLKQASNHSNEVRRLFEKGQPWQKRAIFLSLKMQTAFRSTPLPVLPKRTRISSTPIQTVFFSSDSFPEIPSLSEQTYKRGRNPGDSKTSGVTNTDHVPYSDSEFITDQDQALTQWNQVKHSDVSTLSSNNRVNADIGLVLHSDRDSAPWLPLALDSSSDSEPLNLDSVPPLSIALDSSADTESSVLDAAKAPIEPVSKGSDVVSSLSFFPTSFEHKPKRNDLNESHPKVLAFIHAMKNIKCLEVEPRQEKRLFANLLTIMGEFFELDRNPDSPMKKFIAVVLTVESLYKMALVIYPDHEVASVKLRKLQARNKSMLNERHYYVPLFDDLEIQSDKKHYENAIESAMTDLEVLYSGKTEPVACVVNSLFKYITGTILKFKLMNTDDLSDLMEQFHGYSAHTDVCSSSTYSLPFN